jgi:hypothetical protein
MSKRERARRSQRRAATPIDGATDNSESGHARANTLTKHFTPEHRAKFSASMRERWARAREAEERLAATTSAVDDTSANTAQRNMTAAKVTRLQAELNQVPMSVQIAQDALELGMSVVIILNFLDSVDAVAKRLRTVNTITGQDDMEHRRWLIQRFNADEEDLIVMTVKVGCLGVGISLHSGRPRLVFASATRSERRAV